jgi:hypothetical protein
MLSGQATTGPMLGDIEEFITGHPDNSSGELERVLATVLSAADARRIREFVEMLHGHSR